MNDEKKYPTDHPLEPLMASWEKLTDTSATGFAEGDCYRNCARFVLDKTPPHGLFEGSPLLLCHGEVRAANGTYHGHAWVEWGDGIPMVFDPSTGKPEALVLISPSYYEKGGIDPDQVKRYEKDQVSAMMRLHERYGPWEEFDQDALDLDNEDEVEWEDPDGQAAGN